MSGLPVEDVHVDDPLPTHDHITGHILVSELGAHSSAATSGCVTAASFYGLLNWSFALRPANHDDFIFSYAGSSQGTHPLTHVSETPQMYATTFAAALADMLESYVDKEVHQALPAVGEKPDGSRHHHRYLSRPRWPFPREIRISGISSPAMPPKKEPPRPQRTTAAMYRFSQRS